MGLVQVHASIATAVMLFNALLGVWGFVKFLKGDQEVDGNYAGGLAISPIIGLVQLAIGFVLVLQGLGALVRFVHYLYGALVILAVPATFAFTRGRDDRGALLIYASVTLLNAAFGLRAYTTAFERF